MCEAAVFGGGVFLSGGEDVGEGFRKSVQTYVRRGLQSLTVLEK
jgi:hypothetical protein